MDVETLSSSSPNIKQKPKKPFEKIIWIANSTGILFSAFWAVCICQDLLVWLLGNVLGISIKLSFDNIFLLNGQWSASQVLLIFGSIPLYYLVIGMAAGILYKKYRLKKDLRKLFFLWLQYLSFSIFAGSFITSFIERGDLAILWEYMHFGKDFMPLIAFFAAALLIFFGVLSLWKFLNISPSSEINKTPRKRMLFILCTQLIPILLLFALGFVLYPNSNPNTTISSRFFSAFMVLVPVLAGLIALVARDGGYAKVPAFKDSDVSVFQPIYWGLAALAYAVVLFIS